VAAALSAAFFGVAAFLVDVFLGVAFLDAAFFGLTGALAFVLVTRPDLVLPSTFSSSTTASA